MIANRSIFTLLVFTICVAVPAQVPPSGSKTTEQPVNGSIDGKVVNENGQPLAGAAVFVRTLNARVNRSTTTDVDGNFRVNGLEPGIYTVGANSPAYTSAPGDPDAPKYYRVGDSARVEMVRGGAITGTVTNSTGEPVIAVRVRAMLIRDAKGQPPRVPLFGAFEQPTDDRGIYRIYGLAPGTYLVSAGGGTQIGNFNQYESDVPTFAPSSTRDTAAEVTMRGGEDVAVDIRYRGEPGHSISGNVKLAGASNASIFLTRPGSNIWVATTLQVPGMRGFVLNGLTDGDYDLVAQESLPNQTSFLPLLALSEPKRITIKGADISGIELVTKPLGSINGKLVLEPTKLPECQGKRPPLLDETLVRFRRPEKDDKEDPFVLRLASGSASPDATGAFSLRNLMAGKYQFELRFYARYWYLQSITVNGAGQKPQRIDAAANWTTLKSGEQLSNLNITLAEGAASIRGKVPATDSASPPAVVVYLVPNDKDKVEDVLRYFVTEVEADGTFTFNSLPPGRYLALTQTTVDAQIATTTKLRVPEAAAARAKLRRTAETNKAEIELKPCQNLADYQLKQ